MKWLNKGWRGMPLLGKDLVELAARRRTYVIRSIYALGMFTLVSTLVYDYLDAHGQEPLRLLGSGGDLFSLIVGVQFIGVYLLLPAMLCGVITYEKERNALVLIVLTDLKPWEILLQKALGRLIPMACFILLSMPLLAMTYSYGGVSVEMVFMSVYYLLLACAQVAAIALAASTYCRSTAGAFILTYVVLGVIYFGPALSLALYDLFTPVRAVTAELQRLAFCFFPVFPFAEQAWSMLPSGLSPGLPIWGSIAVALAMARWMLLRRMLVTPRNVVRAIFLYFDRAFDDINRRFGNVTLIRDRVDLPENRPLAWREMRTKSIGKARYLMRLLLVIEIPLLIILGVVVIGRTYSRQSGELEAVTYMLWPILLLILAVHAVNLFAIERSRQTLDVLLTTPLSGEQIMHQKLAALRRLMLVLAAPLMTVALVEAWWEYGVSWTLLFTAPPIPVLTYLLGTLVTIAVYLPMVAWLSVIVGLKARSATRAVMITIFILVIWNSAWMGVVYALMLTGVEVGNLSGWMFAALMGPMLIVPTLEQNVLQNLTETPWLPIAVNAGWYCAITLSLRWYAFRRADELLGRLPVWRPATGGRAPMATQGTAT